MNTNPFPYRIRLMIFALVALCVPAALCHASVEPELTMAIRQKNVPKVQQLLASGADVNARDEGAEQTPLMWAAQMRDVASVQILLAHGAAIDARDDFGKTALMFATERDDAEIIKLLLRKGADISVRSAKSGTAAEIARERGHASIIKLLSRSPRVTAHRVARPNAHPANRVVALQ